MSSHPSGDSAEWTEHGYPKRRCDVTRCLPSDLVNGDISLELARSDSCSKFDHALNGKCTCGVRKSSRTTCDRVGLRNHDDAWYGCIGCLSISFTEQTVAVSGYEMSRCRSRTGGEIEGNFIFNRKQTEVCGIA